MSQIQGKYELELNFVDDRIFLNYWDYKFGNDVVAEIIGGKLFQETDKLQPVEISFPEYLRQVGESISEREK